MTTMFRTARRMAEATPETRNRYVDFLRALAIGSVVIGHWLMAAVWMDGGLNATNILGVMPKTQWLTWIFQVMPIFFFVGGYANAVGFGRANDGYGTWIRSRLVRLVAPTAPLIAVWAALGLAGPSLGIDPEIARIGSQVALVPLWFLATYLVMIPLTPLSLRLWRRHGIRFVAGLAVAALVIDAGRAATSDHIGFANYISVWGAIYMLGHAWYDGYFTPARRRALFAVGLVALVTMTILGPYHPSMVGVPGVEFGNTAPPSAALLAFGVAQIGVALLLEARANRILANPGPWTATVLVNGSIMTLYLWHMTAMALSIGALVLLGGTGLHVAIGSTQWWLTRPLWILGLGAATAPFIAAFARIEQRGLKPARTSNTAALVTSAASAVGFGSAAAKGMTPEHPIWAAATIITILGTAAWLRFKTTSSDTSS